MLPGDMKMVNLVIDDETFAGLSKKAAARGLSVEQWLKATTENEPVEASPLVDLPIKERLQRFDEATRALKRMNVGSGGMLDDSRESIYGNRGL
jgi:hypothetical protein